MPQVQQRVLPPLQEPRRDERAAAAPSPVPDVSSDLLLCPEGRQACRCRTTHLSDRYLANPTDAFFVTDARARGYLCDGGSGITGYYRDHGLVHPRRFEHEIKYREVTGFDFAALDECE